MDTIGLPPTTSTPRSVAEAEGARLLYGDDDELDLDAKTVTV